MSSVNFKRVSVYGMVILVISSLAGVSAWVADAQTGVPVFSVTAVERNESVTIVGSNFPPHQTFTVRMGPYGGYGVNGTVSNTSVKTGDGSFTATIAIPAGVQNMSRIAMRLDNGSIYYSYNWFWNNSTNQPATGTGLDTRPEDQSSALGSQQVLFPTIGIERIEGEQVTFRTYGFPANQTFHVYMGSRGSSGYSDYIGTMHSGDGSDRDMVVTIPSRIAHYGYIWLRLDSGQYAPYVGFYNPADVAIAVQSPSPSRTGGSSSSLQPSNVPVWHGTPTMTMCTVAAGDEVTFVTQNLTTHLDYTVRMNAFGTMGHNGYNMGTLSPGNNPSIRATFKIPAQLAHLQRIAIRLDAPGGYHAYNWFWNNSAVVC